MRFTKRTHYWRNLAASAAIISGLSGCALLDGKGSTPAEPVASVEADQQTQTDATTITQPSDRTDTTPRALASKPNIEARGGVNAKEAAAAAPDFNAALAMLRGGRLDDALNKLEAIQRQYPTLLGPLINQSIILRQQNKADEAYKRLQAADATESNNPYLLNEYGIVARLNGHFKEARASYQKAINLHPTYAKAHYNMGVLMDLYLHDPAAALAAFEAYQSLQAKPDKQVAGWIKELERRAE